MRMRRAIARGVVLVMALTGLGVTTSSCSVSLYSAACNTAPKPLLTTIDSRLRVSGTLRNGYTIAAPSGWVLVSAELHLKGTKVNAAGDILTFATRSGKPIIRAVDAKARQLSTWPKASFGVYMSGVITSRGCVERVRGTVPCINNGNASQFQASNGPKSCQTANGNG
jgi:hypothetical protein